MGRLYIYLHENPSELSIHVGKYTIHRSYGNEKLGRCGCLVISVFVWDEILPSCVGIIS